MRKRLGLIGLVALGAICLAMCGCHTIAGLGEDLKDLASPYTTR